MSDEIREALERIFSADSSSTSGAAFSGAWATANAPR